MQKSQLFVIAAALIAVFSLYVFGRTVPPQQAKAASPVMPATAPMAGNAVKAADFSTLLQQAKGKIPPVKLMEITTLENSVVRGDVKEQQIKAYRQLASVWDSLMQGPVAAHYLGEAAKLENSEKSLTFAANLFLNYLQHTDDESVRKWESNEAVDLLQKAQALDPKNDTIKVAIANAQVQGGDVMDGVQQLLAVIREDSDNVDANLLLGKLSVTSGQYDKAIERLENVIAKSPDNAEAIYFLAISFREKGDNAKAITYFERCKAVVKNPDFGKEIDSLVNTIQ